jgi:chromosome segregation ATPase
MSQIETIMLVALGFVGALLVGLLVVRGLWTYAVSLGKRRVERRAPSAIAELRADRDRLKAEYAMQGRRLQLRLDDLKTRMAEQMAEASRNRNRIEHLADETRRRDEEIAKRNEEADNLRLQITALERELTDRTELLQQAKDLLQVKEEISAELQGKLKTAEAKVADQWFIIETFKNDGPAATADLTGTASSKFDSAQERLRQRIEEMNDLTRQIDEQRQDLSVQQDELAILREQINRSREADARVAAASKAGSRKAAEKPVTANDAKSVKSARPATGDQLEQKILDTERETETLTEELSRLDKMWNGKDTDSGTESDATASPDKSAKQDSEKTVTASKSASKSGTVRKAKSKPVAADTSSNKTAGKPAGTATATAVAEKSPEQPASGKAADAKADEPVAMAQVKLPGSSMDVAGSAPESSQPAGQTLATATNAGNNNIISLAQRIRALHGDMSGNS